MATTLTNFQKIDFIILLVFESYWGLLLTPKKKLGLKSLKRNIRNIAKGDPVEVRQVAPKKNEVIYDVIRAGTLYHCMMSRIGAKKQTGFEFPKSIVRFFAETTDRWIDDTSNKTEIVTVRKINDFFEELELGVEF